MNQLGIFAKYWQPGAVKTRLAKSIGEQNAASVYRCCLEMLLLKNAGTAKRRLLCITPSSSLEAFELMAPDGWEIWSQSDGNLGDRMKTYFDDSFSGPSRWIPQKVVLIGSDCPLLGPQQIDNAFNALDQHDVVLGPSVDGGYYLVGMKSQAFDIFDGVDWSTDRVLRQTRQKLDRLGLACQLLAEERDLDTLDDLQHYGSLFSQKEKLDSHEVDLLIAIQTALNSLTG